MSKHKVTIANPAPGGVQITSLKNACRFVARGDARFISDNRIEFLRRSAFVGSTASRLQPAIDRARFLYGDSAVAKGLRGGGMNTVMHWTQRPDRANTGKTGTLHTLWVGGARR